MDKPRGLTGGLLLPLLLWGVWAAILLLRPPLLNFTAYRLGLGEAAEPQGSAALPASPSAPAPIKLPAVLSQPWPQPPARPLPVAELERQIATATQEQRKRHGKGLLTVVPPLTAAAAAHSARMAEANFLGHTSPDGDGTADRFGKANRTAFGLVSENVITINGAADTPALADRLVNSWLNSPGHRRNLLDPAADQLGVGCAERTAPQPNAPAPAVYCTQLFLDLFASAEPPLPEALRAGQPLAVRIASAAGLPPPRGVRQVALGGSEAVTSRADLAGSPNASGTLVVGGPAGVYRLDIELPAAEPGRLQLVPGPYLIVTAP